MRYNFVKQHDTTDCAAACLAMICLYYKKETTIAKLRDIMGTDLRGTNLIGLVKCAEKLEFDSKAVRVDREGFFSKYTKPCIANVITKEGISHFVVIYKVTPKSVVIGDPARHIIKEDPEEFLKRFTGIIVVLKPKNEFVANKIETQNTFWRFVNLMRPQKNLFIFSILASLIITILGIVSSLFNKIIMDEILPYQLDDLLLAITIIFLIVTVTQLTIEFVRSWIMLFLSQKIEIPLMLGYFKHIYNLPMRFFAARKTGDIITRFSDAFTIKDIFTNIALTVIMDTTMAIITAVILARMNMNLFVLIGFITITNVFLLFIFKQPYKKLNEEQMQQNSILNSQIIEGLEAVETIKSNSSELSELENIEKEYIKSLRLSYKEGMMSNIQGIIANVVQAIGNIFVMYIGIKQVINGDISLGGLLAFMTLSDFFMDPIGRLVSLQLQIQEANISMKRIAEILDYEQEKNCDNMETIDDLGGSVELNNVTFRYGNRLPVLENVSLKICPGEKVAIVGESGSGKSTIAKLLLKYYDCEDGNIKFDGLDIKDIDHKWLRQHISYMPQKIQLFSKSIYDNIRISRRDATNEEIIEAAKMADAHGFIKALPMQYSTYLEESGNGLSGGEKQRIALARTLLKNNAIYIFDEPTSNLDFATENVVFKTIYNNFKNKTMIIIAHRLAMIKHCDRIIVLHEGKIKEEGNHEELLKKRGYYYKLWGIQQGDFSSSLIDEHDKQTLNPMKRDDNIIKYT